MTNQGAEMTHAGGAKLNASAEKTFFIAALVFFTALPFVVLPFFVEALPEEFTTLSAAKGLILLLSATHVWPTLYFFLNNDGRRIVNNDPGYFYGFPLLVILASTVSVLLLGVKSINYYFLTYYSILLWHHARQNLGVYSFLNKATDSGRPLETWERRIIVFAFLGGAIAISRFWFRNTVFIGHEATVIKVGMFIIAANIAYCCYMIVKSNMLSSDWKRALMLFFFSAFFLPSVVYENQLAAFGSFAAAHGLQYWIFMSYVAGFRLSTVAVLKALGALALLGFLGWHAAKFLRGGDAATMLGLAGIGAYWGYVYVHFIIDARMWRMSNAEVRNYHMNNFRFLRS